MPSPLIAFALLSLVFAGIHDVVFRRYALKERSRGVYIFGIGLVWGALQAVLVWAREVPLDLSPATLHYGLAGGLLLTVSNLCLLESLTEIEAGLGSMIYRLNSIGVVLLSVVLLQEPLGAVKAAGVGLGAAAVWLLYQPAARGGTGARRFALFFALAVFAALCRALYGVVSKQGLMQGASLQGMLLLAALCWIGGGAFYAVARERRFRITGKKTAYALLSGGLVFLIVNFLLLAMAEGEASVAVPVANMGFVVAVLLSAGLGMERITRRKIAALAVALGALWTLAQA